MSSSPTARATPAAGGVLWRAERHSLQVALVHRPRYDDWTLPKGKLSAAEHPLLAAIREVAEETGARSEVGRRLATVEYPIGNLSKRVSYWSMRYLDGEHQPSEEVDEIRWFNISDAAEQLTYPIDRGVLGSFGRLPPRTTTVLLVRHAKAGKRNEFKADDRLRPLDKIGRRQARHVVPFLDAFNPLQVLAADRVRCEQTVEPLARHRSLPVISAPEFSDEAFLDDPRRAQKSLEVLVQRDYCSVVCSQGVAIPGLLHRLEAPAGEFPARKGSVWALSVYRGHVVAADYYPHPTA